MGMGRTARVMDGGGRGSNTPRPEPSSRGAITRASSADSIITGLERMCASEWNGCRADGSPSDVRLWITASLLARLGELPSAYITSILRNKVEESLDYVERVHIPGSGWSETGAEKADVLTTSWTVIALRSHRRPVPEGAVNFLLHCRQADGGFSAYPGTEPAHTPGSPEITVTALRALNTCDRAAGDFLASSLRHELSSKLAHKSSRFYMCSEILDWDAGLPPWPVLHLVSQSAVLFDMEGPYEQALLVRILLRMRNQRACLAAAALRRMQLADGSWPVHGLIAPSAQSAASPLSRTETRLLTSATAISALAMHAAQQGSYSASEMPQFSRQGGE